MSTDSVYYATFTLENIKATAQTLKADFSNRKVWLLSGAMGSGKTTLIEALCRHLGYEDQTSSPTFSIINEYPTKSYGVIYHLDLYRLESSDQLWEIGFEELLEEEQNSFIFIEWPDLARPFLTGRNLLELSLESIDESTRKIQILNE